MMDSHENVSYAQYTIERIRAEITPEVRSVWQKLESVALSGCNSNEDRKIAQTSEES